MDYIVPSYLYKILKWTGLVACPGVAVFIGALGAAWGMEPGLQNALVTTVNALGVLIGSLLGVSQVTAKPGEGGSDA